MSIIGIGTDIVSVTRIRVLWERFGPSFARRILTDQELISLEKTHDPIGFLAKRYAAKEAFVKALGTGFRARGISLTDIGVLNDELGKPYLVFSGNAALEVNRIGVRDTHVSLSDEKEFALAFIIMSK